MKSYSNDSEVKKAIIKNIKKHGCHISLIKGDGYNPTFGYTVGLSKGYNHSEIIVLGLDLEPTNVILNNAFLNIRRGVKFKTGVGYPGFLEEHQVQFLDVNGIYYKDYLGYAGWYNDNSWNFRTNKKNFIHKDGMNGSKS